MSEIPALGTNQCSQNYRRGSISRKQIREITNWNWKPITHSTINKHQLPVHSLTDMESLGQDQCQKHLVSLRERSYISPTSHIRDPTDLQFPTPNQLSQANKSNESVSQLKMSRKQSLNPQVIEYSQGQEYDPYIISNYDLSLQNSTKSPNSSHSQSFYTQPITHNPVCPNTSPWPIPTFSRIPQAHPPNRYDTTINPANNLHESLRPKNSQIIHHSKINFQNQSIDLNSQVRLSRFQQQPLNHTQVPTRKNRTLPSFDIEKLFQQYDLSADSQDQMLSKIKELKALVLSVDKESHQYFSQMDKIVLKHSKKQPQGPLHRKPHCLFQSPASRVKLSHQAISKISLTGS